MDLWMNHPGFQGFQDSHVSGAAGNPQIGQQSFVAQTTCGDGPSRDGVTYGCPEQQQLLPRMSYCENDVPCKVEGHISPPIKLHEFFSHRLQVLDMLLEEVGQWDCFDNP